MLISWIACAAVLFGQAAPPAQAQKPPTDPVKAEAFSAAVRKGDLAAVKQLLDSGVDVNTKFRYDATAISFASDRGYAEIVKLLIERGADVNVKDTFYNATPLTWAAGPAQARTPGHAEVVRLLLKAGATGNAAALSAAVSAKDAPMVKVILDHGGLAAGPLTNALEAARSAKATDIVAMLEAAGAKPAPVLNLTAEQLEKYVGTYETPAGMQIILKVVDGKLVLDATRLGAPPDISLVARSETQFAATTMAGLTVNFQIQDGKVMSAAIGASKFVRKEAHQ